jgi:hypothetical protein
VNPAGDHPICTKVCSSDDASCSAAVTQCLQECNSRVRGVDGVCALCLLDGAHSGTCAGGGPCCPEPEFPSRASACAAFCGG